MAKIEAFLSQPDYRHYRNVRAAADMFVVLGGILTLGGGAMLTVHPHDGRTPPPAILALAILIIGLAGAIGGISVVVGNQRLSKLIYVMACLYVLAFPIGTILSLVIFTGL